MSSTCDVNKLLNELLGAYLRAGMNIGDCLPQELPSGVVDVPFGDAVPTSLIKAMVPILNERLVGREVTYERISSVGYVREKARIKNVAYADYITTSEDMRGLIIVVETLEEKPRVFETYIPIKKKTTITSLLNAALLLRDNPWLVDEITSAAKEASEALAKGVDAVVKAYAALKLLSVE